MKAGSVWLENRTKAESRRKHIEETTLRRTKDGRQSHGWIGWRVGPHTRCNVALVLAERLEIDGRRRHAGVTEPALNEIDRYAGSDRMNAVSMTQALRRRVRTTRNADAAHERFHKLPRARPRKRPKPFTRLAAR